MTLEAFYFMAQIAAALAVIASLIFVGLQVRAQTAEQAARRLQDRTALTVALTNTAMNKEFRQVLLKANQGIAALDLEEMMILNSFARQLMLLTQTVYASAPKGGLPDRSAIGTLTRAHLIPAVQDYWPLVKGDYSQDFVEFVERLKDWGIGEGFDTPIVAPSKEPGKAPHDA